jgi:predicted small integral membrane protein
MIMRLLEQLGSFRMARTVLTAIATLYMGLVVINNITDFPTNRAFVEHVLAMDTTFKSSNTTWRAVASPGWAVAVYVAIITWEALIAIALAAGLVVGVRSLATGRDIPAARHLSIIGWLMTLILFGAGFIAIGGEWFEMWQSQQWNGLQPAVYNFLIASVGLIVTLLSPDQVRKTTFST